MVSRKVLHNNRYMIKGSLKKNGFDRWRFVLNGFCNSTGEEKTFFIEVYIINPQISPNECVLGFKNRFSKTSADLQYALAGTKSAESATEETFVQPSFVMIKAGSYGAGGKQINSYYPSSQFEFGNREYIVRAGGENKDKFILTDKTIRGSAAVTYSDLNTMPELLCNAGSIDFNLQYEIKNGFENVYSNKETNWIPFGSSTVFAGTITLDGEEYKVVPKSSFGYIDKNWGKNFQAPFFHLSSSDLSSEITGRKMTNSCFAVQGEFEKKLCIYVKLEDRYIEFIPGIGKKYSVTYECTEMPKEDDDIKLHWTASIRDREFVIDLDVFCKTSLMFVRDYESPEGGRKVMKVLGSGNGSGEIRLYRNVKKNLELLEHSTVANVVCEFGDFEYPEK